MMLVMYTAKNNVSFAPLDLIKRASKQFYLLV